MAIPATWASVSWVDRPDDDGVLVGEETIEACVAVEASEEAVVGPELAAIVVVDGVDEAGPLLLVGVGVEAVTTTVL